MNKEIISDKQGIALMVMLIIGTSSIVVTGLEAKKDLLIAIILSILMTLPLMIIYARLHHMFKDKDLFDILEICFGRFIGKFISILYVLYLLYVGASILWVQGEFAITVSLSKTPRIIVAIIIIINGIFIIKKGMEVMGRWTEFFVIILITFILSTVVLMIPNMNINNIRPILGEGIKPVIKGATSAFAFPFSQTVVFTMAFSNFKSEKSSYKIYVRGLFLGGIIILITSLNDVLVLGINTCTTMYFPTYVAASKINIGDILQRIEVIIGIIFMLGAFIKLSIYLLAFCKGISKVFGYTDYRFIVIPASLLMMNLSDFVYESLMYYSEWVESTWVYISFPFHVAFPVFTLIVAEIRKKGLVNN
ncbi:MAG: endospore germination permease [Anaeromicrobium sp.]|uniref:GerAB/ArcD/ProY family transporter n=1 Tax=Anaeromicrobium sp. TaxID=1929132 RepID=UPI0025D10C14|nr:endospore germination permease [Anaeromicrobium sp.]MCT4592958.1 endospore germination permease [Anaeromicrobium sp.]